MLLLWYSFVLVIMLAVSLLSVIVEQFFFYNYQKEADFQFENFASQVLLCTALKRARDLLELLSCFSLDC